MSLLLLDTYLCRTNCGAARLADRDLDMSSPFDGATASRTPGFEDITAAVNGTPKAKARTTSRQPIRAETAADRRRPASAPPGSDMEQNRAANQTHLHSNAIDRTDIAWFFLQDSNNHVRKPTSSSTSPCPSPSPSAA